MNRIALGVEYDGTHYFGWQRQAQHVSIQSTLEHAIARVADHAVTTVCAGRTDAKVHAFLQVVHFDTAAIRSEHAWLRGINTYLPRDIRVKWVKSMPPEFNARQSAIQRRYNYVIMNHPVSSGALRHMVTWVRDDLDMARMQAGANYLLGTHDFSAFRGADCQAKTPVRTIVEGQFREHRSHIIFDIAANAFLHHMVRNIVGSLLWVGRGKRDPEWISTLLASRDRTRAGAMAPAQGLYLVKVSYSNNFDLPCLKEAPWFL